MWSWIGLFLGLLSGLIPSAPIRAHIHRHFPSIRDEHVDHLKTCLSILLFVVGTFSLIDRIRHERALRADIEKAQAVALQERYRPIPKPLRNLLISRIQNAYFTSASIETVVVIDVEGADRTLEQLSEELLSLLRDARIPAYPASGTTFNASGHALLPLDITYTANLRATALELLKALNTRVVTENAILAEDKLHDDVRITVELRGHPLFLSDDRVRLE